MPDFPQFASIGAGSSGFPQFGAEEEPDRGILGSIIASIGRDLQGAAKVAVAVPGSVLETVGFEVPISWDDLDTRDKVGGAMVASMFVGGGALSVGRGIAAGVGAGVGRNAASKAAIAAYTARLTTMEKVAQVALAEASAGAFFGAVKPLESSESRLEEIFYDTAFFGAAGGGFAGLGSAWKATFGARIAHIKGQTRAALTAETAKRSESSKLLTEFAGVKFRDLDTGIVTQIQRLDGESVKVTRGSDISITKDYGGAVADAAERGEFLGLARDNLSSPKLQGLLDPETQKLVDAAGGDLSQIVDLNSHANYTAVQKLLHKASEEDQILTWLGAETVTPWVDDLGAVALDSSTARKFKQDVLSILPKDEARRLAKITDDAEFMREAVLKGAVDVDGLYSASEMKSWADGLIYAGEVPTTLTYTARNPYDTSFFSKLATPTTLAKIHPEITPLVDAAGEAAKRQRAGMADSKKYISDLLDRIPKAKWQKGVDIIEASAEAGGVRASRAAAIALARETGDDQLIDFVTSATERLNVARLRFIAAGRLGASESPDELVASARESLGKLLDDLANPDAPVVNSEMVENLALEAAGPARQVLEELIDDAGLAGYFPIVNSGGFQAQINGEAAPRFFETRAQARAAIEASGMGGFISNAINLDSSIARTVSPKEFGKLVKAVREASEEEISSAEAARALTESGTLPSAGPPKFSKHLQRRRLGVRDFAESPDRALDLYLLNAERTVAWNSFEREANAVIENLPSAKTALKRWAEEQRDLMLGRPTAVERAVADWMKSVAPEVSSTALRKYSGFLRHVQGISKLGGVWSGIVNSTQFLTNSTALLGAKYAAVGGEAFFNPRLRRRIEHILADNNVDLGLHLNLSREGELIGGEGITESLKSAAARFRIGNTKEGATAGLDALENMWMFSFNHFERSNRLGTFWGGYKKALDEGMDSAGAAAFAEDLVKRTQFDYSVSNIPQALQGPVGSVIGQFKTFFINEVEFIASLSNAERAKLALTFQALGGTGAILAVPGADLVDSASRLFFDNKLSEEIKLEGGREDAPMMSRLAAFGVPGLFNADLTNYIGPGGFKELTMGLAGPTMSDAGAWKDFMGGAVKDIKSTGRVLPSTYNAWMQRVMPAQIRRIQRGWLVGSGRDLFQGGAYVQPPGEVRNPYSGKLLYRPDDRLAEAWKLSFGIPEVRTSTERIQDEILRRETDSYRANRESFRKQIALARISGNGAEVAKLMNRARGAGITFDMAAINSAAESFSLDANTRQGLRTPRDLRTEFEDFYDLPRR